MRYWPLAFVLACTGPEPTVDDDTAGPTEATGTPKPNVDLTLSVESSPARVVVGSAGAVTVRADRLGLDAAVNVEATSLPPGVSIDSLTIGADADTAELTVVVDGAAPNGGPFDVVLTASAAGVSGEARFTFHIAGLPGAADLGFGEDGTVLLSLGSPEDRIEDLALDAAGRLIAVGATGAGVDRRGFVTRLLPDGTTDPGFNDGASFTDFGKPSEAANVVVTASGLVYVEAYSGPFDRQELLGFDLDGSLLDDFGKRGRVTLDAVLGFPTDLLRTEEALLVITPFTLRRVDFQGVAEASFLDLGGFEVLAGVPDGAGGVFLGGRGVTGYGIERRTIGDWTRDASFGDEGRLEVAVFGSIDSQVSRLVATGDGRAVALGTTGNDRSAVFRFDGSGSLDETFGTKGIVESGRLPAFLEILARQIDGRLLVGSEQTGEHPFGGLARLSPDGASDASFGTDGVVRFPRFPRELAYDPELERVTVALEDPDTQGIDLYRLWL